jgi:hypothetical protein
MSPRASARLFAVLLVALASGGCGGQASNAATSDARSARAAQASRVSTLSTAPPPAPRLVVTPARATGSVWQPVARIGSRVAAWQAQRSGVTLLRFDQQLLRLDLHAGTREPSGTWYYGDRIEPSEIHRVVAAFNGGFKFATGVVGWMSGGRVAVPLQSGRGSIVTYRDGTTAIGAWNHGVPASGRPVYSVLQNLSLLVDHRVAAASAESCIQACWGATIGGMDMVARSALGVTSTGELVWGAGEHLLPGSLARALIGAGVARAVELDINPDWVAGYLYVHGGRGPTGSPVVAEQLGIAGRFLEPYSRDFFAVLAR